MTQTLIERLLSARPSAFYFIQILLTPQPFYKDNPFMAPILETMKLRLYLITRVTQFTCGQATIQKL